jgi:hypothetical protein
MLIMIHKQEVNSDAGEERMGRRKFGGSRTFAKPSAVPV